MQQALNGASAERRPEEVTRDWQANRRWEGIERPYSAEEVVALRGSIHVEHTLARVGAERLWALLNGGGHVNALGAMTGGQAVQMAKAGLRAIYLSGWQVAADANLSGQTYPDQSLYPADSAPALVRRLNEEQGLTVLLVEQNANAALDVSNRAYLLEVGKVVLEGPSADLRAHEGVRTSYLGY